MKKYGNHKNTAWMMSLCFAPMILFVFLTLYFPKFAYLSAIGLLICPLSMGLMIYFTNKRDSPVRKITIQEKHR